MGDVGHWGNLLSMLEMAEQGGGREGGGGGGVARSAKISICVPLLMLFKCQS